MDAFDAYRARPGRDTLVALLEATQDSVYNLCHQVLRHSEDAQDAAQHVLMGLLDALPRISDAPHLKQWLHRAAFHVSLDLKKTQKRRREREARVAMSAATTPDDAADEVQLHVSRLDDELRTLVVEHYFERKPLPILAGERGCSTVAVWKKLERAREKLRDSLTRAGWASPMPGLDRCFASIRPVAAPKGLLTKAMLTKAATVAVLGGIAMKMKMIAAVTVLVLGGAAALGVAILRQREERRQELDRQAEARAKVRPSAPTVKVSTAPAAPPPTSGALAARAPEEAEEVLEFRTQQEFADAFRKAAAIPEEAARWKAFRRIGFLRTPEQFRKVENEIRVRPETTEYEREFPMRILRDWLAADVKGCVQFMMRIPTEPTVTRQKKLEQLLFGAASQNREGTLAYARTLTEEEGRSEILKKLAPPAAPNAEAVLALPPGGERVKALEGLVRDWARTDPRAAAQWVDQLPEGGERSEARSLLAAAWGNADLHAAAAWINEVARGKERQDLLSAVVLSASGGDPKGAIELAVQTFEAKSLWGIEMDRAMRLWGQLDPPAAVRFLQSHPIEGPADSNARQIRTGMISGLAATWATRDPSAALEWAEKLEGAERTATLVAISGSLVKSIISDPKEALAVMDKIPEPNRAEALGLLVDSWAEIDPRAAAEFAHSRPDAANLDEVIARKWAKRDFPSSLAWAKTLPEGIDRDSALLAAAITVTYQNNPDRGLEAARVIRDVAMKDVALEEIAKQWGGKDLDRAIATTSEIVDPTRRKESQGYLLGNFAGKDPEACLALLLRMPEASKIEYGAFAQSWAKKDARAATTWAEGLRQPELREWTLYYTFPEWAQSDRDAAQAWVTQAALSEALRQKLLKLMPPQRP